MPAKIAIKPLQGNLDDHIVLQCKCRFCGKNVKMINNDKVLHDTLTGDRGFHCGFCIKNNFHTGIGKNIMIISFRGIIGFYYYCRYRVATPLMFLREIDEHISLHKNIGLRNPVFSYDDETYCWFIDFSKVGKGSKQLRLKHVINTITEILASFNLYDCYPDFKGAELSKRYSDAVMEFFQKRSRPVGKKILAPTLLKCAEFKTECNVTLESTRNFTPEDMILCDKFKAAS